MRYATLPVRVGEKRGHAYVNPQQVAAVREDPEYVLSSLVHLVGGAVLRIDDPPYKVLHALGVAV